MDGRHRRPERTRAALLAACRAFMLAGQFRPTMDMVAKDAGLSVRSAYTHFGDIESLYVAAAYGIRLRMLQHILGGELDEKLWPGGWVDLITDAVIKGRA